MEWCSALTTELGRLPTPYIAEGFWKALKKAFLTTQYPSLVHDITHGSLIGEPVLTHMTIMSNLWSVKLHPSLVADYIAEEVLLSCMSGPFTLEETPHF